MIPIFSILIATTTDRRRLFEKLLKNFQSQIDSHRLQENVQIFWLEDNKEISIGLKRQRLLDTAQGEYIAFFDSDDLPYTDYLVKILKALEQKPDCVGLLIDMTTNGKHRQTCCHSLKYKEWKENVDGYDYVRNVTHFNPVKRQLALQAGFPDLRFGEDQVYSNKVTALCKTQVMIHQPVFHYRYSTAIKHNEKYGIR